MTDLSPFLLSRREAVRGVLMGPVLLGQWPKLALAASSPSSAQVLSEVIEELVTANRILAHLEIVDSFGHISRRHPTRPGHFLMSRARAPALIDADDIMEFDAEGGAVDARGRKPYVERFIHAAVYATRADVASVVHDHSDTVVPFSISSRKLRAASHAGGPLGNSVPVWDIRTQFGDRTNMLVSTLEMGRDLARTLGKGSAVLMRGHGAVLVGPSIRGATIIANSLERQARLLLAARQLGGRITYLSPGEVEQTATILDPTTPGDAIARRWEDWCNKVGRPFVANGY